MASAIYNVHHRNRKSVSGYTAKETIQRDIQEIAAAALQHAIDTARIAFAPSLDLSLVPSASIIACIYCIDVSMHPYLSIASLIVVLIFSTAFCNAFSKITSSYLHLVSSRASNSPVEAPLGAVPLATVPSIRYTSASTVGFPLESRISLPTTFSISKYMINPLSDLQFDSTERIGKVIDKVQ